MKKLNPRLRYFIRVAANGDPVLGSMIARKVIPRSGGNWRDITDCVVDQCCTTSSSSTTTTTTTL